MARPTEKQVQYHDVTLHVDSTTDPGIEDKLDLILEKLGIIERSIKTGDTAIMTDLSALQAEVQQNTDATASITSLVEGLAQQLRDAAGDPAAVQALADQLDANTSLLVASVQANTPQGSEVPAGEVPEGETPIEDQPHPDNTLPGDLPSDG